MGQRQKPVGCLCFLRQGLGILVTADEKEVNDHKADWVGAQNVCAGVSSWSASLAKCLAVELIDKARKDLLFNCAFLQIGNLRFECNSECNKDDLGLAFLR